MHQVVWESSAGASGGGMSGAREYTHTHGDRAQLVGDFYNGVFNLAVSRMNTCADTPAEKQIANAQFEYIVQCIEAYEHHRETGTSKTGIPVMVRSSTSLTGESATRKLREVSALGEITPCVWSATQLTRMADQRWEQYKAIRRGELGSHVDKVLKAESNPNE